MPTNGLSEPRADDNVEKMSRDWIDNHDVQVFCETWMNSAAGVGGS